MGVCRAHTVHWTVRVRDHSPHRAAPDLLLDFASLLTSDPGDAPQNANRAKPKRLGAICLPAWSGRGWRRSWEHHLLRLGAVGLAALSAACRLSDLLGRNGSLAYTLLLCQCHFDSLELKGQGYMWRGRPVFDAVPVSEPVAELNRCGRQAAVYILALSLQGEAGEIPVCSPGDAPPAVRRQLSRAGQPGVHGCSGWCRSSGGLRPAAACRRRGETRYRAVVRTKKSPPHGRARRQALPFTACADAMLRDRRGQSREGRGCRVRESHEKSPTSQSHSPACTHQRKRRRRSLT